MKRLYEEVSRRHLKRWRQMLFLVGPRQVGKTTTGLELERLFNRYHYLSWDIPQDRLLLTGSADQLEHHLGLDRARPGESLVVLDEIHKLPVWKDFLKGFFDAYEKQTKILVTGSARLDLLRNVGDSLMGRYFLHRVHPLSVGEIVDPHLREGITRPPQPVSRELMERLLRFGGFPEPYFEADPEFVQSWQQRRFQQLFQGDLSELAQVRELAQIELLGELLRHQVGQILNHTSLATRVGVTSPTIKKWIDLLRSFFYCYTLSPWSRNIPRSLLKNPKPYLWDWSQVEDLEARIENFVASHLLKACHHWTDLGRGTYHLHFLRDKDGREVDFLVTCEGEPWLLLEVKRSLNHGLSKSLRHFHQITGAPHTLQAVFEADYEEIDCFDVDRPAIVPLATLLSQLV